MIRTICSIYFAAFGAAPAIAATSRVATILKRGELVCGLPRDVPGFAVLDDHGGATGFDADLCRAVAVTILGKPNAIRFVQVDSIDQFVETDFIDLVFHGLTTSTQREAKWNVAFGPPTYIDGQAFAVRASITRDIATGASDIRGPICIEDSARRIANLRNWLTLHNARNPILVFPDRTDATRSFRSGECAAWSADASILGSTLAGQNARSFRILPERISVEPLAPIVRASDRDLLEQVTATLKELVAPMGAGLSMTRYDRLYLSHFGGPEWPTHGRGANSSRASGGSIGP